MKLNKRSLGKPLVVFIDILYVYRKVVDTIFVRGLLNNLPVFCNGDSQDMTHHVFQ